ncbi:MAG: purine-binding chemotaxis protein CheW, partial [Myxococcales bacterium]
DVHQVVQIIHPLPYDPLPYLPSAVVGVADFRGAVVPVIDLRQRFGVMATEERPRWLVVRSGQAAGAFVVDQVYDVFGVAASDIRPAPQVGASDERGLSSVLQHRGRMTFVLDMAHFQGLLEAADDQLARIFEVPARRGGAPALGAPDRRGRS